MGGRQEFMGQITLGMILWAAANRASLFKLEKCAPSGWMNQKTCPQPPGMQPMLRPRSLVSGARLNSNPTHHLSQVSWRSAESNNNYATDCNDPDLQRAENMPVQRRSCRENQGVLENCKAFIIARAETHKAESSKRWGWRTGLPRLTPGLYPKSRNLDVGVKAVKGAADQPGSSGTRHVYPWARLSTNPPTFWT